MSNPELGRKVFLHHVVILAYRAESVAKCTKHENTSLSLAEMVLYTIILAETVKSFWCAKLAKNFLKVLDMYQNGKYNRAVTRVSDKMARTR
nr:MAG TPA: hypothetical protein [Caudoviricetes sp.]